MPRKINCDSYKAIEYIETHIHELGREEIIEDLMKITKLARNTLQSLYYVVHSAHKVVEEEPIIKETYKGRERNFFKFDTSKLWREVNG